MDEIIKGGNKCKNASQMCALMMMICLGGRTALAEAQECVLVLVFDTLALHPPEVFGSGRIQLAHVGFVYVYVGGKALELLVKLNLSLVQSSPIIDFLCYIFWFVNK